MRYFQTPGLFRLRKRSSRDLRRVRKNPEILKSGLAKFPLQDILFKEDVNDMVTIWTTSVVLDYKPFTSSQTLVQMPYLPGLYAKSLNTVQGVDVVVFWYLNFASEFKACVKDV